MADKNPPEVKQRYKKIDKVSYPLIFLSVGILIISSYMPGNITAFSWLAAATLAMGISLMARSFSFKSEYEALQRLDQIEKKLDKILEHRDDVFQNKK